MVSNMYGVLSFYAIRIYKIYIFQDHSLIHFRRLYTSWAYFFVMDITLKLLFTTGSFSPKRNFRTHEVYFPLKKYSKATIL